MNKFLFLDGDGIGDLIELLLLDGKLAEARSASERINSAMVKLRNSLESTSGVRIELFGGDDLIAVATTEEPSLTQLEHFRNTFRANCGCTISAGVGASIQEALSNLRRAKISGKNQLIS
jgi:hypothetical protein